MARTSDPESRDASRHESSRSRENSRHEYSRSREGSRTDQQKRSQQSLAMLRAMSRPAIGGMAFGDSSRENSRHDAWKSHHRSANTSRAAIIATADMPAQPGTKLS